MTRNTIGTAHATPPLRATVRLQFHSGYTLFDAVAQVPYFAQLGISHVYASPLLMATPGSTHGYDTINWHRIDPERGGEEGLRALVAALRAQGMGLILDIVPNHMGVGCLNHWWDDVLAHGPCSQHARFFDIDWNVTDATLRDKVLLPFLGEPLGDVLAAGGIALHFTPMIGGFMLHYGEHRFPVCPEDTRWILLTAEATLPADPLHEWLKGAEGAAALALVSQAFAPGTADGQARLTALLDRQHYRLAWWRTAGDRINWRRFFDITSLVALRMEDDAVFDAAHTHVFALYREGLIDGLRLDHVDGLARPGAYLTRLREQLDSLRPSRPEGLRESPATIHVEKIVEEAEILPALWPVDGTTGYDFLDQVSLVLHDDAGQLPLTAFWERFGPSAYDTVQRIARVQKLEGAFHGDFGALIDHIHTSARALIPLQDITRHAVQQVLEAILLGFPVYRSYFADRPPPEAQTEDRRALAHAVTDARHHLPAFRRPLLGWIQALISGDLPDIAPETRQTIVERFEHLTAPLSAKAGEDTSFYRYMRLLSRNDVGCDPSRIAVSPAVFHEAMATRQRTCPGALLATATHDHKRGEDARARLMLLSEPAANWPATAEDWLACALPFRHHLHDGLAPHPADELFLFQTLIAVWPYQESEMATLPDRLWAYWQKALREGGQRTSWEIPDDAYESACETYLGALLDPNGPLRPKVAAYVARLAPASVLNSLAQTALKLTVPGVPDLYQGTELWDFSLVDPDNRRPVDYTIRARLLNEADPLATLAQTWTDGAIKQRVIHRLLQDRQRRPALYASGTYHAVNAIGPMADHLIAFERRHEGERLLVIVPRHPLALTPDDALKTAPEPWQETRLAVSGSWRSLLDDETTEPGTTLEALNRVLPLDILVPA